MTPASCKQKGRRFQQWIRDQIIEVLGVHPEDIESRSMGAGGEDIMLAKAARDLFPFSVEAKNKETHSVFKDFEQAKANSKNNMALLAIKRNRSEALAILSFEDFIALIKRINDLEVELRGCYKGQKATEGYQSF